MRPEKFISVVVHPLLVLPLAAGFYLYGAGLDVVQIVYWLGIWIGLSLVPTTIYVWFGGDMQGLNIRQKEMRGPAFAVGLFTALLSVLTMWYLSAPLILVESGVIVLGVITVFAVANYFDRVSIHTGSISFAATVVSTLSVFTGLLMAVAVIGVGWSRVKLEAHTFIQVLIGGFLGVLSGIVFVLI